MRILKLSGVVMLLITFLSSCKNGAVEFNNSLVKIQQSVLPKVQDFAKKMEAAGNGGPSLKDLRPEADSMVALLEQKITEVNAVKGVEGGEDLRNAILDQMKLEKDICYKTGKLGDDNVSADEKLEISKEFMNSGEEAKKIQDRIASTQKAFAEKNKFTLETK